MELSVAVQKEDGVTGLVVEIDASGWIGKGVPHQRGITWAFCSWSPLNTCMPIPSWCSFEVQRARFPISLARLNSGKSMPANMAMIAITTSRSMRVKADGRKIRIRGCMAGMKWGGAQVTGGTLPPSMPRTQGIFLAGSGRRWSLLLIVRKRSGKTFPPGGFLAMLPP